MHRTCGLYDYFENLSWRFKEYPKTYVKILATGRIDHFSYEITYEVES